jgi:homoserine kinase
MMSGDLFHEPYREVLLPDLARMREVVWRSDAYGAALSGSGPTFVTFTPAGRGAELGRQFTRVFPHFEVRVTSVARRGATVSGRAG